MGSASLHVEKLSTPFSWSLCSAFHHPPYKSLCLHWDVQMGFEMSPPSSQITGIWINHLLSHQHLTQVRQAAGLAFSYVIILNPMKSGWIEVLQLGNYRKATLRLVEWAKTQNRQVPCPHVADKNQEKYLGCEGFSWGVRGPNAIPCPTSLKFQCQKKSPHDFLL